MSFNDSAPEHGARTRFDIGQALTGLGVTLLDLGIAVGIVTLAATLTFVAIHEIALLLIAQVGQHTALSTTLRLTDNLIAIGLAVGWVIAVVVLIVGRATREWEGLKRELRQRDRAMLDRMEADVDALLKGTEAEGFDPRPGMTYTPGMSRTPGM